MSAFQKPVRVERAIPFRRKENRADRIYRVAAQMMCQRGYEATSMSEIARAARITKAGLYHYIRGKEELLFEIMSYAMDVVDEHVVGPAREIADAEGRLRAIVERHTGRILEGTGAITTLLSETWALTPAHRRIIRGRQRAYFDFIRQTLEQLSAQGRLRNLNPTVATFALLGMILWIPRWYRRAGKVTPPEALKDFFEMATHAVLKTEPRASQGEISARRATVPTAVG